MTIIDDGSIRDNQELLQDAYVGSQLDFDELRELEGFSDESISEDESQVENEDPNLHPRRVRKQSKSVYHAASLT